MIVELPLSHRYSTSEVIGSGARSIVYRGYDLRLRRTVAIKVLRPEFAADEASHDRLHGRARDAAILRHAAIVAVYDSDEADTAHGRLPYIVMEHVDGRTLRDAIKTQDPMDAKTALEITADVCAVLDFAHRQGIAHHAVEPGNVMLTKAGAVKVMGFGSAIDPRSDADLQDAGRVLRELISSMPPFPDDPPPAISLAMNAVVRKALAAGSDEGYRSAAEMRSDLVRVLSSIPPPGRRRTPAVNPARMAPSRAASRRVRDDIDGPVPNPPRRRGHASPVSATLALVGLVALVTLLLPDGWFGGGDAVTIPRVEGKQFLAAEHALHEAGFGNVTRHLVPCWAPAYGEKPACPEDLSGKAIRTEPEEGIRAVRSTQITLYVGQGPKRFPMPAVLTAKRSAAVKLLAAKDLLPHPSIELIGNTDPAKTGTIAAQEPRPGAVVAQGDVVRLSVYRRPEIVEITDYTGRFYDAAQAGLSAAGFVVVGRVVDSDLPGGVVVRQNPGRGKAVKGSEVVLEASNGAHEPMTVPDDLIGMTEPEARDALLAAGHTGEVRIETRIVEDIAWDGRVTATYPSGGDTMTRSGTVTLYLGMYRRDGAGSPHALKRTVA